MSIVKINAITVHADSGDELARRFAARAGAVDGVPGFEGFELLQPTDGRNVWLVVTRWADEESFEAWKNSASFGHGHGRPVGTEGAAQAGGGPEARDAEAGDAGRQRPVGVSAELWSFEPADLGK
ncbi:antibiotic biosynthesis monooxygenase family protein [Sinomonas sp. B1-1]|uniref:antibiotic biosynthesis monooxygenase family protein n=1 Tax=Sinomonas sp. B1-1 TaxID=3141454 RepID=UPI003D29621B